MTEQPTRRHFLGSMRDGLASAALLSLFQQDLYSDKPRRRKPRVYDLSPKPTHFAPKAKAVIHLFMQGGPSQVDLFDPKEKLTKFHGKSVFKELAADVSSPESAGGLMRSPFKFKKHGESGAWVSNLLPHFSKVVDQTAIVRSMFNTHPNHEPALFRIQSGQLLPGTAVARFVGRLRAGQ